jgi:predicted anti-sigma-YlaC factor YlaD
MISCHQFLAELQNYLENDLAIEVRRQVEDHLAHCLTCQVLYDSIGKTLHIVTDSGSFDLPDTTASLITANVMSRIRETASSSS